ncbi:MAG: VOC family protein [Planctomycetes bacterium]|nr:VOC family protein [Planctomycetota bacterium]
MNGDAAAAGARLNLLTLRAADLRATAAFYEVLGFTFAAERHGVGPEHLASISDGPHSWTLELYPATCAVDTQALRLGFEVANLDEMLERLVAAGGQVATKPRTGPQGRRAVVGDPDGRRVELVER